MADCTLCALPFTDVRSVDVLVTDHWHVYAPCDLTPGAYLLQTRRHVEGLWALDEAESAGLGDVLRQVSAAIRTVYTAEKVYVMALGEAHPHFHLMMLPRGVDVPADQRGLKHVAAYFQAVDDLDSLDRTNVHLVAARLQGLGAAPVVPGTDV